MSNAVATPAQIGGRPVKPLSAFKVGSGGHDLPDPIRLRNYILAMPGQGKTTFAASIPGAIHIDPEDTRRFVLKGRSRPFVPSSGEECADMFESLIADKARTYKHVVVDTIEKLVQILIPFVTDDYNRTHASKVLDIREKGTQGSGWGYVNEKVLNYMQRLYDAGYGWTVCGHLRTEMIGQGDDKRIVVSPLVNEGIRGGLFRDAQYIMRTSVVTTFTHEELQTESGIKMKGKLIGTRMGKLEVKTVDNPKNSTTQLLKDRLGQFLPDDVLFDDTNGYDRWSAAYVEACKAAIEAAGK